MATAPQLAPISKLGKGPDVAQDNNYHGAVRQAGYEQGPVVEVDDSGQFKVFYIDRILETRPLSRRGLSLEEGDLVAIDASRTVENIGYGTVVALHRDNTATIKPQISRRRVRVPVDALVRRAKGLIAKRRRAGARTLPSSL